MFEPDHERGIGVVQNFHSGIPARKMSVGKSKMWNDINVQGVANNLMFLGSENNGSRILAEEPHSTKCLLK